MNYQKQHFAYFGSNVQVQWKREDGQLIQNQLTISDYDFHIRKKKGKMLLIPISELVEEVVSETTELDLIIEEMEHVCDAYREWCSIWLEEQDMSKLMQAPYEVLVELTNRGYDVFDLIKDDLALDVNVHSN